MNRDPFLEADPLYRNAISKGSRNGAALEIVSAGIRMGPSMLVFAAVVALCAVAWCVS